MKHWTPILMAVVVSLATACGDDDGTTPADGSGTTGNPPVTGDTTNGPTTDSPTTDSPTTDSPTTDSPTTDGPTTDDGTTTAPTDGTASDSSSGGDSGTTDGGSSSSEGGSSSDGGMMGNCALGDGPDFAVTNNGFTDYVIDGANDPGITVVRGCSYTFTVNAVGHPFVLKSVQGPGLLNTYDDGVTNQGTQNGVLTWDVPIGAPNSLFYNCQFHAAMTGTITVIDG